MKWWLVDGWCIVGDNIPRSYTNYRELFTINNEGFNHGCHDETQKFDQWYLQEWWVFSRKLAGGFCVDRSNRKKYGVIEDSRISMNRRPSSVRINSNHGTMNICKTSFGVFDGLFIRGRDFYVFWGGVTNDRFFRETYDIWVGGSGSVCS